MNHAEQREEFADEAVALMHARSAAARLLWLRISISAVIAVGLWILWRPAGATFALVLVGYCRPIFMHYGDFWKQNVAFGIGLIVGVGIALIVHYFQLYSGVEWLGASWFAGLGLLTTSYIGYGTSHNAPFETFNLDRNRAIVGVGAFAAYLVTLGTFLVVAWASRR